MGGFGSGSGSGSSHGDRSDIVADAEAFVRLELAGIDGSHDWWHINRVRTLALSLASEERLPAASLEVVELAALLHDVRDWKYSGDVDAGADAVREWLTCRGYPDDKAAAIVDIISRMGFKEELASAAKKQTAKGGEGRAEELSREFKVVQDADRLDAIGAIGIARTFCYGGAKGDPMHVPGVGPREKLTKEQYMSSNSGGRDGGGGSGSGSGGSDGGGGGGGGVLLGNGTSGATPLDSGRQLSAPQPISGGGGGRGGGANPHVNTTINHFHEKLLTLKGLMKSEAGRRRAEKRHRTMLEFLEHFHAEWDGNE